MADPSRYPDTAGGTGGDTAHDTNSTGGDTGHDTGGDTKDTGGDTNGAGGVPEREPTRIPRWAWVVGLVVLVLALLVFAVMFLLGDDGGHRPGGPGVH